MQPLNNFYLNKMEAKHEKWFYEQTKEVSSGLDKLIKTESGKSIAWAFKVSSANLIAEAGTVANETGKSPKQLVDENKELLEALSDAIIEVTKRCTDLNMDCTKYSTWQKANKAIHNATK